MAKWPKETEGMNYQEAVIHYQRRTLKYWQDLLKTLDDAEKVGLFYSDRADLEAKMERLQKYLDGLPKA